MASSRSNQLSIPVVDFMAEQGALTVADANVDMAGGTKRTYAWADAIEKGYILKLDATNSRSKTVMNRTVSDQTLIGIAHDKPRFENFDSLSAIASSATPTAEEQQTVAVEIFGGFIRAITIDADGTLPDYGGSVQGSDQALGMHEWTKDATANNTITLGVGTLGAQDTLVMFNYLGVM